MIKYLLVILSAVLLPSCTTVVEPVHTTPATPATTSVTRQSQTTVDPFTGGHRTDTTTTIAR